LAIGDDRPSIGGTEFACREAMISSKPDSSDPELNPGGSYRIGGFFGFAHGA